MICFVCNLPILSHQVGLVWQGGNGVDDLLREQMEMDIIRGRLGGTQMGRRDSSAQITTIEACLDEYGSSTPPSTATSGPKRRRSSLAQLTDLLRDLGSRDKYKDKAPGNPRRGTLAELGRSLGGIGSGGGGRRGSQKPEADFLSKARRRRETSADITIVRKGSSTDFNVPRLWCSSGRQTSSHHPLHHFQQSHHQYPPPFQPHYPKHMLCSTAESSTSMDEISTEAESRRSSMELQQIFERKSMGPAKLLRRKESRGTMSPDTEKSSETCPAVPTMMIRMASTTGSDKLQRDPSAADHAKRFTIKRFAWSHQLIPHPILLSSSPTKSGIIEQDPSSGETGPTSSGSMENGAPSSGLRKGSLKPGSRSSSPLSGQQSQSQQMSPTSLRRGLRRQSTAFDEAFPVKPGSGRRGSRPFLSPDIIQTTETSGTTEKAHPFAAKSNICSAPRRDSLSPASEEGAGNRVPTRRDSRPLLSPEPDLHHSREGSPRPSSKVAVMRRRSSANSEDSITYLGKPRDASSNQSSREHSPKDPEIRALQGSSRYTIRRQSTTEEILIARGFRRESTTEDIMRCRNFRRQSTQMDASMTRRNRRDSCTQITDGQLETMTIESEHAYSESMATQTDVQQHLQQQLQQPGRKVSKDDSISEGFDDSSEQDRKETPSLYENNHYHEECLKCNSCGMNLSGPNQKRARRFKNQILCDLHFADMALMESSDFMQQLRNFKAQSLGCAVARRKSSTTLIFPLPPQACSDEFCDGYPHNLIPTPGYWIECSRAISSQGSAWTNEERDLQEVDEGITDSPDSSVKGSTHTETEGSETGAKSKLTGTEIRKSKKTPIEEQWEKFGQFGLTSVEQETHEKYFYGTEHWNYFTNDEDLGPVILSLKQENINGRDQFRVLVRAVSYTIHGLIPASCVFADRYNREEVVASLGREINLNPPLTLGQLPDTSEELLKLDQVFIKSELKVGVIYVKEGQYTEEEILGNNEHSPQFDDFISILGEKVRLKGFDRYKGGLDTVHDLTGLHSVFTHWRSIEIMFHVSTLLPFEQNDPQKLQRKRHIGNDIVCVVFLEAEDTNFCPSCIKSHFLHTFIVVRCNPRSKQRPVKYEISVVTRDEVGAYKPYLWEQSVFTKGPMFREWMLTKIVNAERASYSAPKFARMQERTRSQMLEDLVANLQNHAETGQIPKPYRRGSWRPIGHMRPSSPLLDSVRDLFEGQDQLASDFTKAFQLPEPGSTDPPSSLFDIKFIVGQGKNKTTLYGVRAILAVRSRVFQELLYGISTGFGSPQVPVAEILARAVPSLHSGSGANVSTKPKSSNFLQVPEVEGPRPKSVPNSPSIPRAFNNLRNQLSTAWSSTKKKQLTSTPSTDSSKLGEDDKKKWPSVQDFRKGHATRKDSNDSKSSSSDASNVPQLAVPRLSVCADAQKVDRAKLSQTEFSIIEFDGETFRILLTYLHTGSCPLTCLTIPGLICAAEHYDLPELLQACFHHAKQFIRVSVCCQMLNALENYYWRYTSASELVNMILAFIETRALAVFHDEHFLELSESMVQMIMSRNLEVSELAKFECMLKWAKYKVKNKTFSNRVDAKIEFRCCMDRLTRDLKLYRIAPQDLIRTVLPSKAIRNEKILETLMIQANSGMYRVQDSYLEACQRLQRLDSKVSEWESFDFAFNNN